VLPTNFGDLVANLLLWELDRHPPTGHERLLFRTLATEDAAEVVQAMVSPGDALRVVLQLDNGSAEDIEVPGRLLRGASGSVEILPVVVDAEPSPKSPAWRVTQGFASRLRNDFGFGVPPETRRVLLVFDSHPVETETTTAAGDHSVHLESPVVQGEWLREFVQKLPFEDEEARLLVEALLGWWKDTSSKDSSGQPWDRRSWRDRIEQVAAFVRSCLAEPASRVGSHLPMLGPLLADPVIFDSDVEVLPERLDRNRECTRKLEAIREDRTRDPLVEVDKIVELVHSDTFYGEIEQALKAPDVPVSLSALTFSDVEERWREGRREPATLDLSSIRFLGVDGTELLAEGVPGAPKEEIEIVVGCLTGGLRMESRATGSAPAELFVARRWDQTLEPGKPVSIDFSRAESFDVFELKVRPGKKSRKDLQTVRIAVVETSEPAVPVGGRVVAEKAFAFDGQVDPIAIRWNGRELATPASEVESGALHSFGLGPRVRVLVEDRPSESVPRSSEALTLVDALALRDAVPAASLRVAQSDDGHVEVLSTVGVGRLATRPILLEHETRAMAQPDNFLGPGLDPGPAREQLLGIAPSQFKSWIDARRAFFENVIESSRRRLSGPDQWRSVSLLDCRNDVTEHAAARYVDAYRELIAAVLPAMAASPNPSLVHSLVACDRREEPHALLLGPTHPLSVALLATVQRDLLTPALVDDEGGRAGATALLEQVARVRGLPWFPWNGNSYRRVPHNEGLLWRVFACRDNGERDPDQELKDVIASKIRRVVRDLLPLLDHPSSRVVLNVDVGTSKGRYLVDALLELVTGRDAVASVLDVGLVRAKGSRTRIEELFQSALGEADDADTREELAGRVELALLDSVGSRPAHLAFRMSADSETSFKSTVRKEHSLTRSSSFAAGFCTEPVRVAPDSPANEVTYWNYVFPTSWDAPDHANPVWGSAWRKRLLDVERLSLNLLVGVEGPTSDALLPLRSLRQRTDAHVDEMYRSALLSVHCDPGQGPELFVGRKAKRKAVYLVECTDRGRPELPGRDVVTVTAHLEPFRAGLRRALHELPDALTAAIDDNAAENLLADINALRATWVFNFLRTATHDYDHRAFLGALDDVVAMRWLLEGKQAPASQALPLVLDLNDVLSRTQGMLKPPREGKRCDDVIVCYIPPVQSRSELSLELRLVEVKFRDTTQNRNDARVQVEETAKRFRSVLPAGLWCQESNPQYLLLARDLAWLIHEAMERYRAFGILGLSEDDIEERWGIRPLMQAIHSGAFSTQLVGYNEAAASTDPDASGSVLVLDPNAADEPVPPMVGTCDLTVLSCDAFARLLTARAQWKPSSAQRAVPSSERDAPGSGGEPCVSGNAVGTAPPDAPAAVPGPDGAVSAPAEGPAGGEGTGPVSPSVAPDAVDAVFEGFVGNSAAVEALVVQLRYARETSARRIDSLGLFGPKSTGKTELARRIATGLEVPFLSLSETSLGSVDTLAERMQKRAQEAGTPMRSIGTEGGLRVFESPPLLVFIDEVHQLTRGVQDSLLPVLEPDDRRLRGSHVIIDASAVTFVMATTDPGRLREAFRSRVREVNLAPYTVREVSLILREKILRIGESGASAQIDRVATDLSAEALEAVATAARAIPRRAIALLGEVSKAIRVRRCGTTLDDVWAYLQRLVPCDRRGLTPNDVAYIRLVGRRGPIGRDAIAGELGVDQTTVEGMIEPFLVQQGWVVRSAQGRQLSRAGQVLLGELRVPT